MCSHGNTIWYTAATETRLTRCREHNRVIDATDTFPIEEGSVIVPFFDGPLGLMEARVEFVEGRFNGLIRGIIDGWSGITNVLLVGGMVRQDLECGDHDQALGARRYGFKEVSVGIFDKLLVFGGAFLGHKETAHGGSRGRVTTVTELSEVNRSMERRCEPHNGSRHVP